MIYMQDQNTGDYLSWQDDFGKPVIQTSLMPCFFVQEHHTTRDRRNVDWQILSGYMLLLDLETNGSKLYHIGTVYSGQTFGRKGRFNLQAALQDLDRFASVARLCIWKGYANEGVANGWKIEKPEYLIKTDRDEARFYDQFGPT